MREKLLGAGVVRLVRGDITRMDAEALVTAANAGLRGGAGVDGAIHRAAGPALLDECRRLGCCPTGDAVMTGAGNLPVRHVIHAVGPVWRGGGAGEEAHLRGAYLRSLELASQAGLRSIAFPAISCGLYGYPPAEGARVALEAVRDFLVSHPDQPLQITFALLDGTVAEAFLRTLETL